MPVTMTGDVQIEASPVGPVVRPPGAKESAELVILYLHGDRYLSGGRSRSTRRARRWPIRC